MLRGPNAIVLPTSPQLGYHLGCPVWACAVWVGGLFSRSAKRRDWLREYSTVFNTVEGNSTFYATPTLDTVRRWANDATPGFRFALKFPKSISHERQLLNADAETAAFLELLNILAQADRLGPSFLQLGPTFSYQQFDSLAAYLRKLPTEFPYAVEVRHWSFFDEGPNERSLDSLLTELGVDKVLFDSRPLHSAPPSDADEADAQRKKPKTPIRHTVIGTRPMVRIIGRNQPDLVQPWLDEWAPIVGNWISRGLTPYVFVHAPADVHTAELARRFHATLRKHLPSVAPLPPFHGEAQAAASMRQRELF
jgi:uncharacterized protein YecE (DUF72 family)